MLKIKMCGMTRRQDVLEAVRLGVDAVGVVLYEPSPRYVTPDDARLLVADLPDRVDRVGVFVSASAEQIAAAVKTAALSTVQLYDGPSQKELERAGCAVPIIRALKADIGLADALTKCADLTVLLDAPGGTLAGGTGTTWDWSLLDRVVRPRYLMLAGGLHAGNVHEAVTRARPDAVDVSSGIESSPGVKDAARMAAFVSACAPFRNKAQEVR